MQQHLFVRSILAVVLTGAIGCGAPSEVTDAPEGDSSPTTPTDTQENSRDIPAIPDQTVTTDAEGNTRLETEVEGARSEIEVAAQDNSLDLPEGFPQELAYPGASVKFTQWVESEAGGTGNVILIAEASVDTIAASYQTKLADAGWSAIGTPYSAASGDARASTITAEKGNSILVATIATDGDRGNTVISLQVQPQL